MGAVSTRVGNADFSIHPLASINYKTGKLVFTTTAMPYLYYKQARSVFTNRQLLDNSLSFDEKQEYLIKSNSSSYQFGIDYTINEKHSLLGGIGLNGRHSETNTDFTTDQFAFDALTNQQFNTNKNQARNNAYIFDFAYRYDIGDKGARLDFAISNGENEKDNDNSNINERIDIINDTNTYSNNRDTQNQKDVTFSSRLDYVLPLKDKKGNFEASIKYDDLGITDANLF